MSADDFAATFTFGRDGKPLYVPGPSEPPDLVHARFAQLRRHLGLERVDHLPGAVESGNTTANNSN